jgi:tetratricopeptide (TPR) repeat protein
LTDVITDFLERLANVNENPHALSVLSAEFAMATRPKSLQVALDVAAVLRWFDERFLAQILDIPDETAAQRFKALCALPFIERYRRSADHLRSVSESTRLGWREKLGREQPEYFVRLSKKAASCFAGDISLFSRVEWIYHLLCGDPNRGVAELQLLNRTWNNGVRSEDSYVLAAVLRELEDTQLVQGRARVWVLLTLAWARAARGELAQQREAATTILDLARSVEDLSAESEAQCLLGNALKAQEKLELARTAYQKHLTIKRLLAKQDPGDTGRQQDLAVAHIRVGDVLLAKGKLPEAQAAFAESLVIVLRLVENDRLNTDLQRDLLVSQNKIEHVQIKLAEARALLERSLATTRRMVEQDAGNFELQRDLALTLSQVGDALQAQDKLTDAQKVFQESLSIISRLLEHDPTNGSFQVALAVIHGRVGKMLRGWLKASPAIRRIDDLFGPTEAGLKDMELFRATKEEDIKDVAFQELMVYSIENAVPDHVLMEWYRQNPHGFNVILYDERKIGHLNLLPFTESFLSRFIEGKVIEKDAKASDVYPPGNQESIKDLYIESLAIIQPFEFLKDKILSRVLSQLAEIVARVCPPKQIRYIYALGANKDGTNLLLHFGFSEVLAEYPRKDGLCLFGILYADLLRSISKY